MEELWKSFILGIIQGFTEFLPISSTGHLVLGRKYLGMAEAGLLLDTLLHFGTLIAVMAVFWDDIVHLLKHPFSRLGLLLVVGTIPTAIIGLSFEDYFEEISRTGSTIGAEFIITGFILWWADRIKDKGSKSFEQISYKDAFFIGTLQGAAILPAISRSGLTIAGSLFMGIQKEAAARFSFLLSLPAIFGACLLQGKKLVTNESEVIGLFPLLIGTFAAAIAGYIAVRWMLNILKRGSLKSFAYYVWGVGGIIIVLQILGKW
ncbi:undecaprenyl-diphosphate phosphatase [Ammoniphilus sp. YIM 78166]|uniref:undecaprenyl-diphosphate phosphatase n=1 Tax=Ammoniphilus sp. YIM 78166 TaxID=1644106 RepID=UPI00107054C3|nr:undecaprenyl-diphosphate phosphatase [Ammoniphilus sp. YIM 78166]